MRDPWPVMLYVFVTVMLLVIFGTVAILLGL